MDFTFFIPLREKCPYSVFFWSTISRIRSEYGSEKLRIRRKETFGDMVMIFYSTVDPLLLPSLKGSKTRCNLYEPGLYTQVASKAAQRN